MIQAQGIPEAYSKLYSDYCSMISRSSKKIDSMMWVILDRGHETKMVTKTEHQAMIERYWQAEMRDG